MEKTTLSKLKKGEWFTLKAIESPNEHQVYVKGEYDRSDKKYSVCHWDDINSERFLKGTTTVYVGFTF